MSEGLPLRHVGVEDELLLVYGSGVPAPVAGELLSRLPADGDGQSFSVVREFFQAQVELVTSPATDLGDVAGQLLRGRRMIAEAGHAVGAAPVAVAGPVVSGAVPFTEGPRFRRISEAYGRIAGEAMMCALQVHVEVNSRDEGVAVIDRIRPWVPLLLALSANSPFWQGTDTGFASWRSQVWKLWPSTGPVEPFEDVAAYDALVAMMLESGATLDEAMLNLDVRLSARFPTVEFRVADTCTDVEDAVLVAAFARALTTTAARAWARREVMDAWRVDELRVASWRAARDGVGGMLIHPETHHAVPAREALGALLAHTGEALQEAGDLALATRGVDRLLTRGSGAARQREVHARASDLCSVVRDLVCRTVAGDA